VIVAAPYTAPANIEQAKNNKAEINRRTPTTDINSSQIGIKHCVHHRMIDGYGSTRWISLTGAKGH
jgi:hypothetical protein